LTWQVAAKVFPLHFTVMVALPSAIAVTSPLASTIATFSLLDTHTRSLAAAFELGCRCRDEEVADDPLIRQSSDVYNIMRNRLERLNYEEFWVLMLSRSNRVIYEERLSQGGTASTVVDIKLLFKSVIDKLASGIILVHNHPSGNCTPSQEDDRLTHRIKDAGTLLDIKVFDHIIITPNNYYSYADNSRL
jgi:DNA repair protein RadC